MAAVRHLGFSKLGNFNCLYPSEGHYPSFMPNVVTFGQTVAEIWPFFDFSRWRPSAILDFQNLEISTSVPIRSPNMRHRTKFHGWDAQEGRTASACQILTKSLKTRLRYGDFSIFQDGGRRHLGFWKFQIFNGWDAQEGRTASARQILVKSLKTRLRYGDFPIFQNGNRPPSWIF